MQVCQFHLPVSQEAVHINENVIRGSRVPALLPVVYPAYSQALTVSLLRGY